MTDNTTAPGSPLYVPLTTVEPGKTTSEFQVTIGVVAANILATAVAFGVPVTPNQQAALLALVGSLTVLSGSYSLSRGIRKQGKL